MIGRLNKSITINGIVEAIDRGTVHEVVSALGTVFAEIIPASSREAYRAAQIQPELQYLVRIRERADVTAQCNITWGSRTLRLLGPPMQVTIDGVKLLELNCAEIDQT